MHKCDKALRLTSSETPQSFVEETQFGDDDFGILDDLGFLGEDDEVKSVEAVSETAMAEDGAEEDDLSELDPRTVDMMRLLLPRYFDLVRSILIVLYAVW